MITSDLVFKKADISKHRDIVDFQLCLAKESEGIDLDRNTLEQGVISVFEDSHKGFYYIVENNNEVIGCLLLLKEWSDWRNANILWIHSVYVKKEFREQGVFRKMYSEIKAQVLSNSSYAGIRLFVDRTNKRAISVYRSLGMSDEHYTLFEWEKRL